MATTAWLSGVGPWMESALEIVPPHWVDDDEIIALEQQFEPLLFERFAAIVPDAAFEMMSRADSIRATRRKVAAYLHDGVRLVVLIDPYGHRTYVGRTGDDDVVDLGDVASVDCSPVMPGFVLDLATILDVG